MKVTKQQQALLGILILGGAVLGHDLYSGSPTPALAVAAPVVEQPHVAGSPQQANKTIPPADGQLVAKRLSALAKLGDSTSDLPDAFGGSNEAASHVASVPSFTRTYHLNGVLRSGTAGTAVVNGQVVRQGQVVGGYKLVAVTGRTATFESGNERLTLALTE